MSMRFPRALVAGLLGSSVALAASADTPDVATDIAPVHGLVARVMEGLGTPDLVVRPGASPHGYSLRPSEARALAEAEAVFWIGPELEPWLAESIATLAPDAVVVELLAAPGTETRAFREGATFGAQDHADEAGHDAHAGGDEDHARDGHDGDHAENEPSDKSGETGHAAGADAEQAGAGHSHDGVDPHAWLDPENAKAWLDVIAAQLGELDPENAGAYAANAEAGKDEIDAAAAEVRDRLEPVRDMRFVVFHDAYQYFEARFGVPAAGAISVSDASDPSPARIEEIRGTVDALGIDCVFSEPQFDQGLVRTVLDGTGGHSGVIDPLGVDIPTGPGFYPALIRAIGEEMAGCGG